MAPELDDGSLGKALRPSDYFSLQDAQPVDSSEASSSASLAMRSGVRPLLHSSRVSASETVSAQPTATRPTSHLRNVSSATVVYKPVLENPAEGEVNVRPTVYKLRQKARSTVPISGARTPLSKPTSSAASHRTPKKPLGPRVRPIMPPKDSTGFQSAPNLAGLLTRTKRNEEDKPRRSSLEIDLVSDIGDNKAIGGGYVGALPASLVAQMAAHSNGASRSRIAKEEERDMFGRLMMVRMNTLEEGFREVVHEMRESLRREGGTLGQSHSRSPERSVKPAIDHSSNH